MHAGTGATDRRLGVLAFTAGLLAVVAAPRLLDVVWLTALAMPALVPWRFRSIWAMAALGVLLATWHVQTRLDQRWPLERYGEERWVTGAVSDLPEFALPRERNPDKPASGTARFRFETADLDGPSQLRVAWYRNAERVRAGECWRFKLRLKPPLGSANPGAFDYEGWLFREGIGATATVREGERCGESHGAQVLRIRQVLADRIDAALPHSEGRGLFKALTLGDTRELSDDDWDVFRETGTTHLVAISGFNIGLIAGMAFLLFRGLWSAWPRLCLLWPAQKAATVFAVVAAFFYALLAGWEPPVQRAWLMLLMISVAYLLERLHEPSRVLALAWWVILLIDPLAVLSPGLWLSFLAVGSIFYFTRGRWQSMPWWQVLLGLQLLLSIVVAPLTVYFFQGFSWASPFLNLLAVPIVTLLTPLLLLVSAALWTGADLTVTAAVWCGELLASLKHALAFIPIQWPSVWVSWSASLFSAVLAVIGVLLLFAPRAVPVRLLALVCCIPLLWPRDSAPTEGFELTALDVGQGLAVVVRTAHHTLLYDAGPAFEDGFDAGESIVAPALLSAGVRSIDTLLLSHTDRDHSGGASAVMRRLHVRERRGALSDQPCVDGESWTWDGVRFELLHPNATHYSKNNGGCVLRIESGAYAALLPADVERVAEQRLVRERLASLQADVLVAPHHGSRTSSSDDFIAAVDSRVVIHSAAWRSPYGHPHPAVVARYREAGVAQHLTGREGAIRIRVTPQGVLEPSAWRALDRRLWRWPAQPLDPSFNSQLD